MRSKESVTGWSKANQLRVRSARPGDAERLALLSEQLGYPATLEEVQQRLHRIQKREDHAVYLAVIADQNAGSGKEEILSRPAGSGDQAILSEDSGVDQSEGGSPSARADGDEGADLSAGADGRAAAEGCVIGWVHVYVTELLEADPQAEVGGLIIDERYRGHGAGRLLMKEAEEWARGKGCGAICLRSNVTRKDAHAFYQRIGYSHTKTQRTFRRLF